MVARRTLLSQLVVAAPLLLGACATMPVSEPVDRAALRDQLMQLELGSWQDMKTRNVAGLAAFLADDVVLIFSDASRYTKATFLALIPDFTLHSLEITKGPEIIVINPEAATLLYSATYRSATKNEAPSTATVAASSTYVRRNGRWVSVFYQETPTRQP